MFPQENLKFGFSKMHIFAHFDFKKFTFYLKFFKKKCYQAFLKVGPAMAGPTGPAPPGLIHINQSRISHRHFFTKF